MTTVKSQRHFYSEAERRSAERNELFMEMVQAGDMTREDLQALIERRPDRYSRYAGFLPNLPSRNAT